MRDFSQLDLTLANKKIDDEFTLNKIRNGKKIGMFYTNNVCILVLWGFYVFVHYNKEQKDRNKNVKDLGKEIK